MAVPAVDLLVFPDKGKFGQAVIELVQILDGGEGLFLVTIGT